MAKDKTVAGAHNVFADLGYPDAAERQTKVRLAVALNRLLANRKLKQADAAKTLGVPQPKISALANYHLTGFSVERIMQLITSLDHDVEIRIRPRKARSGSGQIVVSEARQRVESDVKQARPQLNRKLARGVAENVAA